MPSDRRHSRSCSPAYLERELSRRHQYERDRKDNDDNGGRSRRPKSSRRERSYSASRERGRDRKREREGEGAREKEKEKEGRRDEKRHRESDRDRERRRRRNESGDEDGTLSWRHQHRAGSRDRQREQDSYRSREKGIRQGGNDLDRHRTHHLKPREEQEDEIETSRYKPRSSHPNRDREGKNRDPHSKTTAASPSAISSKDSEKEKEKRNFANTGLLAAATNTLNNVVLKYTEPLDSRLPSPSHHWLLYTFKGSDVISTTELHTQPCWLFGRDRLVTDFPLDHPSISKQHAVIQFRHVTKTNEYGDKESNVKPYVVDLGSANKTFLNGEELPETRFVELKSGDVVKFGLSTREYVIMFNEEN